ncbi:MAG TPA: fluoride efflux transporter CrcB [Luteolibacter sp.]|nr:fluoride efflux transporter CrcB [Luteolibacter sp.]
MKQILLVGCGGAFGSIARYLLGGAILHRFPNLKFPLGTFTVNIIGCLIIGLLAGFIEKRGAFSPDIRLLLFTGICGGFTTFSAFANEGVFLIRRSDTPTALLYAAASVVIGFLAVWIGIKLVVRA